MSIGREGLPPDARRSAAMETTGMIQEKTTRKENPQPPDMTARPPGQR